MGTEPNPRLASSHAQGPPQVMHPGRPGTSLSPSAPSFPTSPAASSPAGLRRGRQGPESRRHGQGEGGEGGHLIKERDARGWGGQVKTFLTRGTFITAATLYTRFPPSQRSPHVTSDQGGKGITFPSPSSRRLPRLSERRDVDYLESFP